MAAIASCPSEIILKSLLEGQLAPHEITSCVEHIEQCPSCLDRLEPIAAASTTIQTDSGPSSPEDFEQEIVQGLMNRLESLRQTKSQLTNDETAELIRRNPEFTQPGARWSIKDGEVRELYLDGKVKDLSPIRALTGLTILGVCYIDKVHQDCPSDDLGQLKGLKLTHLSIRSTQVSDLSHLVGMPLTSLDVSNTKVTDLAPLKGLPLKSLILSDCKVQDLAPLSGMPIETLILHGTTVSDLTPLKSMRLNKLGLAATGITDLTPLTGMKLKDLGLQPYCVATDLAPLKGMPLESLHVGRIQDASPLKGMPIRDLTGSIHLNSGSDEEVIRSLPLERWNDKTPLDVWKEMATARKAEADSVERLKKTRIVKNELEKAIREELMVSVVGVTISEGAVVGIYLEAGAPNQAGKLRAFPKLKKMNVIANTDLWDLRTLPIEEIELGQGDLYFNRTTLKAMPQLKTINGKPAKEVLK